jgi:hypothetical protein
MHLQRVREVKVVTLFILNDERCYGLREGPRNGRWVERVYVERGDRKAEWSFDHGSVDDFEDITEIMIPSDGGDTVAQLRDLAERNRHDLKWANRRKEMLGESTLIADILRQEEEIYHVVRNRSFFSPGVSTQRNGYPREANVRRYKEKNARRHSN